MSRAAYTLLTDYIRRTAGFWILLAGIQFVHASILWTYRPGRVPLIGPVIGSLAFFVTSQPVQRVLRTLPLKPHDRAFVRWWMQTGLPTLVAAAALMLSWWVNACSEFPVPPPSHLIVSMCGSLLILALVRLLPATLLIPSRSNRSRVALVWSLLTIAALYGYPAESLPRWLTLSASGLCVVFEIVHLLRMRSGAIKYSDISPEKQRPSQGSSVAGMKLRGWAVLLAQLLRSTLLLSIAGLLCTTLARQLMPYLELPELRPVLPIGFVSIAGIWSSLIARRLLQSLSALQCLPVRTDRLAMMLCLVLLAPGFTACGIASTVHWLAPAFGLAIPLYVMPVLAIVPALSIPWNNATSGSSVRTSVARRSPLLQLATWPLWTGSFAALALTKLLPTWFSLLAILLMLSCSLIGYFTVRARIRGTLKAPDHQTPQAPLRRADQ